MRTRDADAARYEGFFTAFQNAVELKAYTAGLDGFPSERALEIGCGTGRTTGTLSSKSIVGIDLSHQELLVARERFGDKVALVQASATHLPFRSGAFDKLLCAGVLLHIPDEKRRALALKEMARTLTRPARLVVSVYSYSWTARLRFPQETVRHDLFWHRFTVGELERVVREALRPCLVKTTGICHLPRWRVGNRLGRFGVWLDRFLSKVPGLKHLSAMILVAEVECFPERTRG